MPLINRDRKQTDSHYRYKMPAIEVKHEGGGQYTRTLITNLKKIAEALNTTSEIINHYMSVELGTESSSSDGSDNRLFLRGTHQANILQDHLDKYIKIYVKCPKCNIPEGKLKIKGKKKQKSVWTYCPSCGHQEDVSNSHKTSNYIKNNWDPEKHKQESELNPDLQEQLDKSSVKPPNKKENNLKLKIDHNHAQEETEWTINELDNEPESDFGFQLPGMELNGFQLPDSDQSFELPISALGRSNDPHENIELEKYIGDDADNNNDIDNDNDNDIDNDNSITTIIECTSEDLEKDYANVCQLILEQSKARRRLLAEILEPIVQVYKKTSFPKFSHRTLDFITNVSSKLELDFVVASTIASFLLDRQIVIDSQIENYRHLLEPFLHNSESQHHFLNCLLILLNHDPELMSEFANIVETLYAHNLVDDRSLSDWHNNLINEDSANILKINTDIPFNVYQILDPLINKIKEDDEESSWEGMTVKYQEIKIMHLSNQQGTSSSNVSTTMIHKVISTQPPTQKSLKYTDESSDESLSNGEEESEGETNN
jgi:translation initiation factor 5